ncbi:hypothetical protein FIU87_13105 [Bacillus sp. THAF10]|nr:hypothetical protein FIU87_13105 [Bacillus sp. THAF10]
MKIMRNRQIKKIEIPKWGNYLRARWRECFASHLSIEEQKAIWMDNFLWHLCSWKKVKCLEKEEAVKAFLNQPKHKCTIFYQFIDDAYLLENADTLSIEELPFIESHMHFSDMYVMDWNNKWTFIMTHEKECGPYFIRRD